MRAYSENPGTVDQPMFEGTADVKRLMTGLSFANSGAELSLSYRLASNVNINANYSYLHMDKVLTGAPEHKAYLGCNWRPGRFIHLSMNCFCF